MTKSKLAATCILALMAAAVVPNATSAGSKSKRRLCEVPCNQPYYCCINGQWVLIDPTNPQDQTANNNQPGVNSQIRINALFAIDSDPNVKEAGKIALTGNNFKDAYNRFCGKQYRSQPEPNMLTLDRENRDGPKKLLANIGSISSGENDIILLYACCHGGYKDGEQYLFLSETDGVDGITAIKRSDIIAELKKKPHHAIVLITDACSEQLMAQPKAAPMAIPQRPVDKTANLHTLLASLPKGTILDINTSSEGQISAINAKGGLATSAFVDALDNLKQGASWAEFRSDWQSRLTAYYSLLRKETLKTLSADAKSAYRDQADQTLDVRGLK